jgi:hypothetical protein
MTPEEFWGALANMPEPKAIFYRLYYDENGDPICYTMEDLPGNYIEIDVDTYRRQPCNITVAKGKLVYIDQGIKLRPSDSGVSCDPRDVCVVVDPKQPHTYWNY